MDLWRSRPVSKSQCPANSPAATHNQRLWMFRRKAEVQGCNMTAPAPPILAFIDELSDVDKVLKKLIGCTGRSRLGDCSPQLSVDHERNQTSCVSTNRHSIGANTASPKHAPNLTALSLHTESLRSPGSAALSTQAALCGLQREPASRKVSHRGHLCPRSEGTATAAGTGVYHPSRGWAWSLRAPCPHAVSQAPSTTVRH